MRKLCNVESEAYRVFEVQDALRDFSNPLRSSLHVTLCNIGDNKLGYDMCRLYDDDTY